MFIQLFIVYSYNKMGASVTAFSVVVTHYDFSWFHLATPRKILEALESNICLKYVSVLLMMKRCKLLTHLLTEPLKHTHLHMHIQT